MPRGGQILIESKNFEVTEEDSRARPYARPGHYVLLVVSDTGTGMDEQTRSRCLEPFFSTKGERGTGLGLAMVYGVVQRHDGTIEIDSQVGSGTVFRLIFAVREGLKADSIGDPDIVPPLRPLRILYVDDEPLLREMIKEILECDGHLVELADGGQAGLTAFRAAKETGKPFEIVVTDLGMPHLDGRQLAQILKRESPATPVIMMTGWGTLMKGEELPPHVDAVLNKPPKLTELHQTLRKVMQDRSD